jgi:hypothetical protein
VPVGVGGLAVGAAVRTVAGVRAIVIGVVLAVATALAVESLLRRASTGWGIVRASWTLTPGVLNPAVTQATIHSTICLAGWTRTVRPPVSYTNRLKVAQLRRYGLAGPRSAFQEDHLISLELGGSPTDPRNLWPEPYPRAAGVDRIENELNHDVCAGKLSLAEAQRRESALKHRDG